MTLVSLFGCILVAFGPATVIFLVAVARDHFHVIIMISSAFFWLLSLLLSSVWWTIVSPLKSQLAFGVAFSVIFQELLRLAFFVLIKKAEESELISLASKSSLFKHKTAFASGLGYGVMSGLFAMVNILADITGPGTPGLDGESPQFLIVSALLTSAFILLNTFWGIIWFESCNEKKYGYLMLVVGSHLFVSLMTLLNGKKHYLGSMLSAYIVLMIMAVLAFKVAGGSIQSVRSTFAKKSRTDLPHAGQVSVVSPTT